jgi:PleD family two-component response regulator
MRPALDWSQLLASKKMAEHTHDKDSSHVLVVHSDDSALRALSSVLEPRGYIVLPARTAADALILAREHQPDAILLDAEVAGPDDYGLCRELRADPGIFDVTPILLTTPDPITRESLRRALRAGAWELLSEPLNAEELLLRLQLYVGGKREVDRLGAAALLDPASGCYNVSGIVRRSQELAALAARQGLSLTCVVFRTATPAPQPAQAADRLASAFHRSGRLSDAIGRTGPAEFTVFAPATDDAGAARLIDRITQAVRRVLQSQEEPERPVAFRSAFSTVPVVPRTAFDPIALMQRARSRLDSGA